MHSAVEGGNLELLKWLVDVHFCPIRIFRAGNKRNPGKTIEDPILTSKGRSVVSIAMEDNKIEILRYLVVEKKMSIYETKDINLALGMLDCVLKTPSNKCRTTNSRKPNITMNFEDYYCSEGMDERDTQRIGEDINVARSYHEMVAPYSPSNISVDSSDTKTVKTVADAVSIL